MSRSDDFRAAIRQAEFDRSLDGSWLIFFEVAVVAAIPAIFTGSGLVGLLSFIVLLIALAAISTSKRAVAITLKIVFAAYAAFFFSALYAFSTIPADTLGAITHIIIIGIISAGLASIPTAYHEGAFRTQDDLSRN